MTPNFSIVVDPQRDLVRIKLSGFFSSADVGAFGLAMAQQYRQLRCAPNHHVTLCDVSEMKIQTQDVVVAFGNIVQEPRTASRRIALIIGSSLARMQTQRTVARQSVAYFKDAAAAEAWLFADDASIAA